MSEHRIASLDGRGFVDLGLATTAELPAGHPSAGDAEPWPPRFTVKLTDPEGDEYSLETTLELKLWHTGLVMIFHHGDSWDGNLKDHEEVTERAITLAVYGVRVRGVDEIDIVSRHRFSVELSAAHDARAIFDQLMRRFELLLDLDPGTLEAEWLTLTAREQRLRDAADEAEADAAESDADDADNRQPPATA